MRLRELRQFVAHLESLQAEREPVWREIAEWLLPHRGIFKGEAERPGERRNRRAFNAAAVQAVKRGAAGMTQGMTPPSLPWFTASYRYPELAERTGAREFVNAIESVARDLLLAGGFYQAIHACNQDLIGFGCMLLYCESDALRGCRFEDAQVGSFAVGMGRGRGPEAVARRLTFTPRALAERFGEDRLSRKVRDLLAKEPFKPVPVVHVVMARDRRDPTSGAARDMPWASWFYEAEGAEDVLEESGYETMPYFFTAWEPGRSVYGTGAGDDALPDARMLDKMERSKVLGLDMTVNPPLLVSNGLRGRMRNQPGAVNYALGNESVTPLYSVNFSSGLQYVQNEIQTVSQRLNDALMASMFASMPLDQRPADMSATEFMARRREAMQLMGPTLSAYEPNVLTPLIGRVVGLADRAGLLPAPPDSLGDAAGAMLKVEFISPMATALRQTGAESTRAIVQDVAGFVQMTGDATLLDKLDMDQAIDELANGIGAPGRVVRSDEEVEAIRQERAEVQAAQQRQMEAMQGLAAMQGAVQTAKTAAEAEAIAGREHG